MPYEIRKVNGGFKVGHKGKSKTYSKKPLTKEKAKAQLRALYANANPKTESEPAMSTPATPMMQQFSEGLKEEIRKQRVREGRIGRIAGAASFGNPPANVVRHGVKAVGAGIKAVGQAATLHPLKAAGNLGRSIGHGLAANPISSSIESGIKMTKAIRKPN